MMRVYELVVVNNHARSSFARDEIIPSFYGGRFVDVGKIGVDGCVNTVSTAECTDHTFFTERVFLRFCNRRTDGAFP